MEKIADISQYQQKVDYKRLKTAVQLAIIRVQFGSNKIDPLFATHAAGCKKAGLPFGCYAFSQFISSADAVREADDFCRRADKEAIFLVLDAEQKTCADMAGACRTFIDTCRHHGWKKVGLYSSQAFYQANALSKVKADFLWIARYGSNNGSADKKPDIPCDLWQYTSAGSVSGISGPVDLSQLNGRKPLSYFTTRDAAAMPAKTAPNPDASPSQILQKGDRGQNVKKMQEKLAAVFFYPDKNAPGHGIDGIYGPKTENAVKRFQSVHNLAIDGIFGPKTAAALEKAVAEQRPKNAPAQSQPCHTVKPGETLGAITKNNRTSIEMLAKLNHLENPNKIYPGQKIYLE